MFRPRARGWRAAFATTAALGIVLVPSPASAAASVDALPPCTMVELDAPAVRHAGVTASDPSGRWLVGWADPDDQIHIMVWDNDEVTQLDLPFSGPSAAGINQDGTVVGSAVVDGARTGFAYVEGAVVMLGTPAGADQVSISGISRRGRISGSTPTETDGPGHAYVWSLDNPSEPRPVRLPARWTSSAAGISADGHVAVNVVTAHREKRAFVVGPQGRRIELRSSAYSFKPHVTAIADGWAAGWERYGGSRTRHNVRWDLSSLKPEIIPRPIKRVTAINEHGAVAGNGFHGSAWVYTDAPVRLQHPDPGAAIAFTLTSAGNPAGYIVDNFKAYVSAARWECPELD